MASESNTTATPALTSSSSSTSTKTNKQNNNNTTNNASTGAAGGVNALPIYSLNLDSNDPDLLTSVERRGARVDEIDSLIDALPVRCF
jgi:hypothetical protein